MKCPKCGSQFDQPGYLYCPYDSMRLRNPLQEQVSLSSTKMDGVLLDFRYRICGFLARGAMARVYLAQDENTGQMVAVKMLDMARHRNAELRERFQREARAVSLIDQENVVRIFDVGEKEDNTPYLVMEFLFGESIGELLEREQQVDPEPMLPLLEQATAAFWAAHSKGIVHRDVKPDNLYLIGEPGSAEKLKVLDFGLSRLWRSDLTMAGQVIGTPSYMAPEQVVAEQTDQRTDVYGLGMVMYRMFAGRNAFTADDEITMVGHQLLTRPPPLSRFAEDIDERLERVVMTAIRKRPENRYPSMQLFGEDLRRLRKPRAELWARDVENDRYDLSNPITQQVANSLRETLREARERASKPGR